MKDVLTLSERFSAANRFLLKIPADLRKARQHPGTLDIVAKAPEFARSTLATLGNRGRHPLEFNHLPHDLHGGSHVRF